MTTESLAKEVMIIDAVDLEVVKASLSGIVQEMQNSLFRTGFSTIVRESQDASCALMNAKGDVVAQHVVLPLHIGAFPACTAAVIDAFRDGIAPGDAFIINHPYHGGSPHAPDVAVITPVFVGDALFGFCGSIAHKSDIGGPVPGSCSGQARETFNEGLHLPAVRYQSGYRPITDIERLIGANSRTPELVLGDIRGQLGADRLGEKRLNELVGKFGQDKILACFDRLLEMSETKLKAAIAEWADGCFEAERFVDDDGVELEKPVRIHVVVDKQADRLHFDFSGSADQTKGPANIRPPLVQAACAYALISLIDPNMYVSSGLLRGFAMTARDGSVLNPRFPAPVNTYNPTIHALVDAIFDAMSHIVPGNVRADGSGSRSIILGGRSTYTGKGYVQYEIIAGGAGARASKDGASGITVNQSNAKIAPIEIIESEFPTRIARFELIADSGGAGEFRGGLGIRREYLNLADARFSIRSMKHIIAPNGCAGGSVGRTGDIWINPDTSEAKRLPTRYADYPLKAGDMFRLDTPGGGGHGDPLDREPERVLADVREGAVSREAAERDYGVVLEQRDPPSWVVDEAATARRRADMRARSANSRSSSPTAAGTVSSKR
jgi:N-methylhydantoinase B